ncbi:MAG: 30S ribosomal protein S7 [Candidatus Thermoplasmatota archaeon]|jgi:small subunit ribosomal protein S7|nr:30S ribosomal protein S7 [Candidatus Thermoplasmatota archaeon]MEC7111746.1 30S ribosomal protein S7 [Candidatus Thermoplasmatota archaeon]MEC7278938.1 30S ribosomal protein S7 [Candidatus Thermoplasmatota archaeon]MEC7461498.1 30S ribosomal protein S7 [Candidatus Thermoplasmatota archaeon]MEC8264062.1 30S ribosomal protein S7 [Candidatus Thermoplasmatota archaeon]|tara:strand:- start:59 stop:667 length:609 start_codon:yes stop_codon:yes gene_type:complete
MSEEVVEEEVRPIAGIGTKVFGKWDASEVTCRDPGLAPYVNLTTVGVPHTGGRHANAWFGKSKLSVVERYVNKLMRTGKYTGKKQGAMKAFEEALDTMAERSGDNPLQLFVDAICYAAPMEEITRIKFGAVSQPKAVDASPSRRLDIALRNLAAGAASGTRKSKRTLTQCIVNELTKASTGDVTAFAVAKKEEVERIAASAR